MQFRAFPVVVRVDDQTHVNVLLFAGDHNTQLWAAGENRQPVLVTTGPPVVARHRMRGDLDGHHIKYEVELSDGARWTVAMGVGCGCGHPLRSFQPSEDVEVSP